MSAIRPAMLPAIFLLLLPAPALASDCFALAVSVAAGDYIDRTEIREAACREQPPVASLAFDRQARALRAVAPMAEGEYLGRLVVEPGIVAEPGDELALVFRDGPVTVERAVSPLAPLRAGDTGLVRAEDGTVFAATFVPGEAAP